MPALIPVDNTLGALSIGAVLSSITPSQDLIAPDRPSSVYGVTWLQVYSYFCGYCSQDRWPLKSFVAVMAYALSLVIKYTIVTSSSTRLIDTANHVLCIYMTYQFCVTNFGDYRSIVSHPCCFGSLRAAVRFHGEFVKQPLLKGRSFYAYRIYRLGGGSPYLPAAISVGSLTGFGLGIDYAYSIKYVHDSGPGNLEARLLLVLCDALITTGMVYYLLSNRTHVRRTNNVLNLLAIYSINCGTIHLVFAVACLTSFAKYPDTLIYVPSLFIMFRLSLCAFMAILNSRDYLRETLDGPGSFVATFTQLKVRMGTPVPWGAVGPKPDQTPTCRPNPTEDGTQPPHENLGV
ncbi:hypothetical protein EDB92DRAFT_1823049 [Lactarius akahatsu]|uniref:DUF6534 domain-containing protein n=1 Tax=Lactarius akahatsu TaxID=416441 RepID=A0AAD4L7U3_9AGAM|nr:hypothetical protein EDB92DRAFT_1823049 [Lactarius akahatsu]